MTSSTYIVYSIFAMFIFSEVMAFSSFIWGYLHLRLSNPSSLAEINVEAYLQISDVLNSGSILTSIIQGRIQEDCNYETDMLQERLVLISFVFLSLQNDEYSLLPSHVNNNWITSYFYVLTGLHSLHVCIGSVFIFIQSYFYDDIGQIRDEDFNSGIYWHFVEMIWIGLTSMLFLI